MSKVKTAIVDKNGKSTHVYKNADSDKPNKRLLPPVKRDTRVNPRTGFTADHYNKLKDILRKHLDRDNKLINFDDEFVNHFLDEKAQGEYWMSNGVNDFKLMGDGTPMSNFHIITRGAAKDFLDSVDAASAEIADVFGHKVPFKLAPQPLESSVSGTTLTFKNLEGEEFEFEPESSFEEPSEYISPSFEALSNGKIKGTWAVDDTDPSGYEWNEDDSFQDFRSEQARDDFIAQKISEGVPKDHIFIVDKYDHGSVSYSVSGTKTYPDHEWDVAPSGVLILDEKGENAALGGEIDKDSANASLSEYTSYVNGETYGIATALFDAQGNLTDEVEVVWGFVGTDATSEVVKENYF